MDAGFTTGTPWLAVNPNHRWLHVAAQRDDPHSVLAHYRRLIALRHRDPVVVDGDFTLLEPDHPRLYAFTRRLDNRAAEATHAGEPRDRLLPWQATVVRGRSAT